MIERQHNEKTLLCDDCDDPLGESYPDGQFNTLIAAAKAKGWKVSPDGLGDWKHQCPDCRPGGGSSLAAQRKRLGL